MRTNAVVFVEPRRVEIQQIEMPPPAEGQVQVRTQYSCISSGTEGWILKDEFTWSHNPFPCVPGYQRIGVVTAVGVGVAGWNVGDRAMAIAGEWDGPIESKWGAHLAVANSPVAHLFHVTSELDDLDAAAGVVAQVGYNAASRPTAPHGSWALVYGDGIIGQFAAQAARARGWQVVVAGHRRERLEIASQQGATVVIDTHEADVAAAVRAPLGRDTIEVVLDSVQSPQAQMEYLPLLENVNGEIVYCGFTPGATWADMGEMQKRELTTYYVAGWTRPRMEATFDLMSRGEMRARPLMTHIVPYTEAPAMFAAILEKSQPFLGITLDWTGAE